MTRLRADTASPQVELISAELTTLRKGQGMRSGALDRRVGPLLRELARATEGGSHTDLRNALAAALSRCAGRLNPSYCLQALAGLALTPETAHMPYFGDRAAWLAGQIDRDYRTALRRIDEAQLMLAEEISRELSHLRGRSAAPHGWYVTELRTLYRLDGTTPEAHEHRRIVAVQALSEVQVALDVPHDRNSQRPRLTAEVLYGGRLVRRDEPSRTRTQFVVRLPSPLLPGQSHEFALVLRAPAAAEMRPHYILTPEWQCDAFDLRVRFAPGRLPAWVRRVDGEPVRTFDDARPGTDPVTVDAAGEARASFNRPAPHLGYGLQWQF